MPEHRIVALDSVQNPSTAAQDRGTRMVKNLTLTLLLGAGLVAFACNPANAQQAAGEADIFAPVTDPNAAAPDPNQKAGKKPKLVTAPQKPVAPATTIAGSEVEQRLQQLEEQIADIHVVVGTMESTGRGHPANAAAATGNGDLEVRIGRLEAQMQGLNSQMAELANEMRALDAKLQGAPAQLRTQPAVPRQSGALAPAPSKPDAIGSLIGEQPAAADSSFGQTTVSQGGPDDPAAMATDANGVAQGVTLDPVAAARQPAAAPPKLQQLAPQPTQQVAALPPPSNDPQVAYDQAYGLILQQDYAGAEAAYRDYVARFPQSPLASNAHYWLGQSYYARGQYKPAADAFLKGYKSFRTGQKAPDSLLKVAMSLSRLGQKDMACSAFTALDGEFPNASVQIKHLAQTERERTGC